MMPLSRVRDGYSSQLALYAEAHKTHR